MANSKSRRTAEEEPLTVLKKPRKTFIELLVETKNNTTVEPIAFIMIISSMLSIITTQTLGLEKVCRVNLRLGNEICNSLRAKNSDSSNTTHYEKAVQEYIAVRIAWRSVIQYTLPSILLLFIGAWSDMTGKRKIFMILPLMGEICQCCSNMINVIFFNQLSVEVLMIFDALCFSVCGGWSVMFHAIFCYICDVSTLENRTYRLGLVNFFAYVGIPIGMAFSGVILRNFGYFAIYGLSLTMHLFNLFYIIFKLPNEKRTLDQKSHDGRGFLYFVRSFFDLNNVKDTLSVVFKKAPKNRRARLIILLCVICILFGPMYGEVAIMYMSTRYRFNWDEVKFSIFQTYNFITHTIGTIFSILVFSKYLKWHDSILGIISTISKIVGSFVYCFAPNGKIFFLAPLVEILNGTSLLAMRSIFSKLVAPNELGKVNSIIGLTENLMPLLYVPLYTKVYTATMEVLPGAVFLMGASMTLPAVCVFIWLLYEHRKGLKKERTRNTVE